MTLYRTAFALLKRFIYISQGTTKPTRDSKEELPEGFDPESYLLLNPDVKGASIGPVEHYLRFGKSEGRAFSRVGSKPMGDSAGGLPEGFDPESYLLLNPDVKGASIGPVEHYLRFGKSEGRAFSLPSVDVVCGEGFESQRENILIVSHEASRTGAPILSLNLVQAFVKHYNVVVLLLGGGALIDAFRLTGAGVVIVPNLRGNPGVAHWLVGCLCEKFNFKFALVNSIESRVVLPALGNCFVSSISLFHEFASYTRPRGAFRDALFWSGEAVFSAELTRDSALAEYPDLGGRSAHVIPQGRCLLPGSETVADELRIENARIRRLMRPSDIDSNSVVVLGAGFIQLRKGVDLFIECASRVVQNSEGKKCRFIWIGKGYDPENDIGYSVYLDDQIRRSGLKDYVSIINETTAIEAAYEEADLFLLSSRLDPMPNVAIDAMVYGVPVLCFEKTTGIADFLISSGLRNYCVADYLDTAGLSEKILALTSSAALREEISGRCREASRAFFCMKDYVSSLEILAQGVCDRTLQEKSDTSVILASGLFRQDFFCAPRVQAAGLTIETSVRAYVRGWASGVNRRKPFPGFHPGVYRDRHGLAAEGIDPFSDYLRAGCPDGPWNCRVIVAGDSEAIDLPDNRRVALHIHAYYPELLSEIVKRLSHNRIAPDLFISICRKEHHSLVADQFSNYQGSVVDIRLVPNLGRDIGPLLTAFGEQLLANYDFVGHIHTKKSADVKDADMGKEWYRFLLENLLGGKAGGMADTIMSTMNSETSIGMVFPDDPNVVSWGGNRAFAERLSEKVGLKNLPRYFVFPVGTMFWARASALAPLINLKLDWPDYPIEPLPYDGTLLHAIERLFPLVLSKNNMSCALTNVVDLTR